jgi:hypothetical protein
MVSRSQRCVAFVRASLQKPQVPSERTEKRKGRAIFVPFACKGESGQHQFPCQPFLYSYGKESFREGFVVCQRLEALFRGGKGSETSIPFLKVTKRKESVLPLGTSVPVLQGEPC